jgi:hypothetical protein
MAIVACRGAKCPAARRDVSPGRAHSRQSFGVAVGGTRMEDMDSPFEVAAGHSAYCAESAGSLTFVPSLVTRSRA